MYIQKEGTSTMQQEVLKTGISQHTQFCTMEIKSMFFR